MTAAVRSKDKAQQLVDTHPEWDGKLKFGYTPDLTTPNVFNALFDKPYDIVIHTASPVAFKVKDVQTDLIDPAIQGYVLSRRLMFSVSLTSIAAAHLDCLKPLGTWAARD